MRQRDSDILGFARDVGLSRDDPLPFDARRAGALVLVVEGMAEVSVRGVPWLLDEGLGAWVPGEVWTGSRAVAPSRIVSVDLATHSLGGPRILRPSTLFREVLGRMAETGPIWTSDPEANYLRVAIEEADRSWAIAMTPPWPRTYWACRAAERLSQIGMGEQPIEAIARQLDYGWRSLERRFKEETGLSPFDWRREARI